MTALAKTTEGTVTRTENNPFDDLARRAKALSNSDLVPQAFRNNPANCLIAMEVASRMGTSPFQAMQSLHVIQGRPSWSAQWLIATVNASGRFTPMRFRATGEKGKPSWGCVAYATDKESGELLESIEVTMQMAADEGWSTKSGSKWKTMPELMLRYRAAAFFTRLYCPEISMGLHTAEEVEDFSPRSSAANGRTFSAALAGVPEAPALQAPEEESPEEIPDAAE